MIDQARSPFEIDQAIQASVGMRFIDREHSRSFSFNIFRTNARELIEALRHVGDPEHGLRLMAVNNREAGTQAHREVSRRIHNFVAAAKSLVDHTRVFMNDHYDQSSVQRICNEEVNKRFSENPLTKFVHDLRNYMLHCGLPHSSMFIHFTQDPEQPDRAGQITTGVRLGTSELKSWGGWTAPARKYLETVGDEVPIEALVKEYVLQVEAFQAWLSEQLVEFHAADLTELDALRDEYAQSISKPESSREPKMLEETFAPELANVALDPFSIPTSTASEIDRLGDELLASIRKLNFASGEQHQFKSDRPIGLTITPDDLIDQPIVWREDTEGNLVLAFILRQSEIYGLGNNSLPVLRQNHRRSPRRLVGRTKPERKIH